MVTRVGQPEQSCAQQLFTTDAVALEGAWGRLLLGVLTLETASKTVLCLLYFHDKKRSQGVWQVETVAATRVGLLFARFFSKRLSYGSRISRCVYDVKHTAFDAFCNIRKVTPTPNARLPRLPFPPQLFTPYFISHNVLIKWF